MVDFSLSRSKEQCENGGVLIERSENQLNSRGKKREEAGSDSSNTLVIDENKSDDQADDRSSDFEHEPSGHSREFEELTKSNTAILNHHTSSSIKFEKCPCSSTITHATISTNAGEW